MNILITICGRAGSKGCKNKNIRQFFGVPLIYYTIACAKQYKDEACLEDTIDIAVNSDSLELLKLVEELDYVTSVIRPSELGQDNTPKISVIKYTLEEMEHLKKLKYDYVIDLDITSPIRKVDDIKNAITKAINNRDVDTVFSVVHARRNPYFNMVEVVDGSVRKVKSSSFITRQQAPDVYDMNASVYCYRRDGLCERIDVSPFDGKCDIIEMMDFGVLDIDSDKDFIHMELICSELFKDEYISLANQAKNVMNDTLITNRVR